MNLGKKIFGQILVMILILTSCMPTDTPTQRRGLAASSNSKTNNNGSGALPGGDTPIDGASLPPKVEIRHLIEPNLSNDPNYSTGTGVAGGGTYLRKLTLPKNFAGRLYVAGINISTLVDRHVSVRFKFGLNREIVKVPATIIQAPGITPSTPISVLVLDLRSEPFRSIRLPYDLYDYNEYKFDQADPSLAEGMLEEPVQSNRDQGLYCRGLKLEDDPTFTGVGACDGKENNPSQPSEECLYAYAKVSDQGLLKQSGTSTTLDPLKLILPQTPSLPQVLSFSGSDYFKEFFSKEIMKPLPDTMPSSSFNFTSFVFNNDTASPQTTNMTFNSTWAGKVVGSNTYFYRGPYRLKDTMSWQFRYPSLDGPKGLFKKDSFVNYTLGGLPDSPMYFDYISNLWVPHQKLYFNSLMFPRATKLTLNSSIPHLSSVDPIGPRSAVTIGAGGTTEWMDGANARAQSVDSEYNHIGSCNVSAMIEVTAVDDNGVEYVIASSKDVKLQLVRPSQYRTDIGNEVLYSNFKSCSSNTQCGGSECCFNNRCWDQALVSQCFDDSSIVGNKIVGQTCSTDLECSSLCCNRTTGKCAPHNTSLNPAVLCSKPVGEFCIAKEWCQKYPITKRLIVRDSPDPSTGAPRCYAYDYQSLEYGDCRNSVCVPPVQEALGSFDDTAPGACNNAVPAPSF